MTPHSPSAFGQLTRTLRGYESRADFAKRLGVGEGTIANIESGQRLRSPKLLTALLREFPMDSDDIRLYYKIADQVGVFSADKGAGVSHIPSTITIDVNSGRTLTARDNILLELEEATDNRERTFTLLGMLAFTYIGGSDGDTTSAVKAFNNALSYGQDTVSTTDLANLRARFALAMAHKGGDDDLAITSELLDAALVSDPTNSDLWMGKGFVHWNQHQFSNAYAAFTIVLADYRAENDRCSFYRAAVLADWGNWESAQSELTSVIEKNTLYHFSALTRLHARSWRAYVLAKQGNWADAKDDFETVALSLRGDAIYHYLRGVCHYDNGEKRAAIGELSAAISSAMHSSLNRQKRERAQLLLAELKPTKRVCKKRKA